MKTPKLRYHKPSSRYYYVFEGQYFYLGRDQAEAEIQYHRAMLELSQTGTIAQTNDEDGLFICELIERYILDRTEFYGKDSKAFERGVAAMRYLNKGFGHYQVSQFGMTELRRLREMMMEKTEKGRLICRNEINRLMREVARFWKWGASMELAPAELFAKCQTLEPLKRGHCKAPERAPVTVVPMKSIDAVKRLVNASVRALIDLQLLTGARPGELVGLRAADIDRSGPVWVARLTEHKTAHRGKVRALYFGPKAQAVLKPFILKRNEDEYLFSPWDFVEERVAASATHRRPDQAPSPKKGERTIGDHYDVHAYRQAITRACVAAGVPHWHPHQLRHTAATEMRAAYGVEAARATLGHAHLSATEIYAEVDAQIAAKIAAERG